VQEGGYDQGEVLKKKTRIKKRRITARKNICDYRAVFHVHVSTCADEKFNDSGVAVIRGFDESRVLRLVESQKVYLKFRDSLRKWCRGKNNMFKGFRKDYFNQVWMSFRYALQR
jgi:hypothetical protein